MNRMLIKIISLTILMMGNGLWGMQATNLDKRLMFQTADGNIFVGAALIEMGANVNAMDEYGYTALMSAALYNQKAMCELLISKGAHVNAQRVNGETALMIAAEWNHKEICELLIANGADLNLRDEDGDSALVLAGIRNRKETCELLINAMMQFTPQERSELTTLVSLKKRRIPNLHSESQKLITKTRLDDIKREKRQNAREEIMKIRNEMVKAELLNYLENIK
jgi:ankyrin repeat protein